MERGRGSPDIYLPFENSKNDMYEMCIRNATKCFAARCRHPQYQKHINRGVLRS